MKTSARTHNLIKLVSSLLTLALVVCALVLALNAAFPGALGWFSPSTMLTADGMQIVVNGEDFDLAVAAYPEHLDVTGSDADKEIVYYHDNLGINKVLVTGDSGSLFSSFFADYDEEVSPGGHGSFTFYIIPKHGAEMTFRLRIDTTLLQDDVSDADAVVPVTSETVNQLVAGHILFYLDREAHVDSQSETYYTYSNHLEDYLDYTPSEHSAEKIVIDGRDAYPVTVYWTWPSTLAHLIYADGHRRLYGSHSQLTDDHAEGEPSERAKMIAYIKAHPEKFFYSETLTGATFASFMDDSELYFIELNDGYNGADQLIGSSATYYAAVFRVYPAPTGDESSEAESSAESTSAPEPEP